MEVTRPDKGNIVTVDVQKLMIAALNKQAAQGGRHLRHRDCIHNLPQEEQSLSGEDGRVVDEGRRFDARADHTGPVETSVLAPTP